MKITEESPKPSMIPVHDMRDNDIGIMQNDGSLIACAIADENKRLCEVSENMGMAMKLGPKDVTWFAGGTRCALMVRLLPRGAVVKLEI